MKPEGKRFLFATWGTAGTMPPELTIARRLLARGHDVRVLGDHGAHDEIMRAGCRFSPWRAPAPVSGSNQGALSRARRRSKRIAQWLRFGPMFGYAQDLLPLLFEPMLSYAETLLSELATEAVDVLVIDAMLFGAMVAAEKARLPTALLLPNAYILPAPGLPPAGPGFMPARGRRGHLRDAVVAKLLDQSYMGALDELNATRGALALPPLAHPFEQLDRADRCLVLTSKAFDFCARSLPANVRYAGAQLDEPAWVEDAALPWPADHPEPLVVVSLSTGFQAQEDLLRKVIEAVAHMPVRALVTVGPAMVSSSFAAAKNVVVRASVSHARVFRSASAVITHAGHGTVLRALAAGVPLVCIPMGRDQNDTAARVVATHAGVRLSTRDGPSHIRAAIGRVLGDASFRHAARAMAFKLANEGDASRAVTEIESLVGSRGG